GIIRAERRRLQGGAVRDLQLLRASSQSTTGDSSGGIGADDGPERFPHGRGGVLEGNYGVRHRAGSRAPGVRRLHHHGSRSAPASFTAFAAARCWLRFRKGVRPTSRDERRRAQR
ncbi:unnamed protein product, partial [Ectocarpus sp. 12 AP-2014]